MKRCVVCNIDDSSFIRQKNLVCAIDIGVGYFIYKAVCKDVMNYPA